MFCTEKVHINLGFLKKTSEDSPILAFILVYIGSPAQAAEHQWSAQVEINMVMHANLNVFRFSFEI